MKNERSAKVATRIKTYERLEQYVRAFAEGAFNLLILVGGAGLQKSRIVRAAIEDAFWIESYATAMAI